MKIKEPARTADAINDQGEPRAGVKSAINDALATLKARDAHPYDGLNGLLPDWMPAPLRHEFKAVRNRLLDSVPSGDVQNWMDLWRSQNDNGWMYVPPEHDRDIDSLVYIQRIVSLGPKAGIDVYLGHGAMEVVRHIARVEHSRKAAQRPRLDGLGRVILSLLRQRPDDKPAGPYIDRRLRELAQARDVIDGVTIEAVEDGEIHWRDDRTTTATATLSGLKDRVSRALKQLHEEKPGLKDSR